MIIVSSEIKELIEKEKLIGANFIKIGFSPSFNSEKSIKEDLKELIDVFERRNPMKLEALKKEIIRKTGSLDLFYFVLENKDRMTVTQLFKELKHCYK